MMESPSNVGSPVDIEGFKATMAAAGIEEIVEPTLHLFVEESEKLFAEMEAGLATGDMESMRRAAHTLKSSAANVHAADLSTVAEGIEHSATEADVASATDLMQKARHEYSTVTEYLKGQGYGA